MSLERAFLDDIIANPDDDAPRLIYADWIDDHGNSERAEFIRLQCRLARLPQDDSGRPELAQCEAELLDAHGLDWAEPLRDMAIEMQFRRGFVEAVAVVSEAPELTEHIRTIMDIAPVQALRLYIIGDELPALLDAGSCLGRLRQLHLKIQVEPPSIPFPELFENGRLAGLSSFLFACDEAEIDPDELAALFLPHVLPPLDELGLLPDYLDNNNDEVVLTALAQADHLRSLRSLHLVFFAFDALAQSLSGCPAFSSLEELGMRQCQAREENWRELLWSPSLDRLSRLDLIGAHLIVDGSLQCIAQSSFATNLAERFPPSRLNFHVGGEDLPEWSGLRF